MVCVLKVSCVWFWVLHVWWFFTVGFELILAGSLLVAGYLGVGWYCFVFTHTLCVCGRDFLDLLGFA